MGINLSDFNIKLYNDKNYEEVGREMANVLFNGAIVEADVYEPKSGASICMRLRFSNGKVMYQDFNQGEVHFIGETIEIDKIGFSALMCEGRENKLKVHYPADQNWVKEI